MQPNLHYIFQVAPDCLGNRMKNKRIVLKKKGGRADKELEGEMGWEDVLE